MAQGDSTGTPVTLVVGPGQTTAPAKPPTRDRIPFTGFELGSALLLAAVLLALGTLIVAAARRVPDRARPTHP